MATREEPRRQILLELLRAALAAVDGRLRTRQALERRGLAGTERIWAMAIGKAASRMALGAGDALGAALERVLLITKEGHVDPEARMLPGVEIRESSHPVPDGRSLDAGARLLTYVAEMPPGVRPLCLISGGASSLVEVLAPGASLQALQRLNAQGLASGLSIEELNALRRQISLIKGGRLAALLAGRGALALFISDVPDDDLAVIGSGLLGPAPVPEGHAATASEGRAAGVDDVERVVVASLGEALSAVRARAAGLKAHVQLERFGGHVGLLAVRFAHELALGPSELRAWGGESVLTLPERPGHGGRNQHFALEAARLIAGYEDLFLLAAGTDGTDGPTVDAGALVDGGTCARAASAGLDVEDCLRRADSGAALAAAGDLVHTGPTGTNVGDLIVGLKLSKAAARSWLDTHPAPRSS